MASQLPKQSFELVWNIRRTRIMVMALDGFKLVDADVSNVGLNCEIDLNR